MDVIIDTFVYDESAKDNLSYDEHIYYKMLSDFVKGRLMPIDDDLEKEETETEGCFVIIYAITKSPTPLGIFGYSPTLRQKIEGCFSRQDFDYILTSIDRILREKNN